MRDGVPAKMMQVRVYGRRFHDAHSQSRRFITRAFGRGRTRQICEAQMAILFLACNARMDAPATCVPPHPGEEIFPCRFGFGFATMRGKSF